MKHDVINLEKKNVGSVELADSVFGVLVRKDILSRVVNWQLAKRRAGTHKTKQIGDVSGRRGKPFKQKGTGNARQGSLRSPQFRGGAIIFGPVVRDHGYDLPKKIRKLGMCCALSSKVQDGKLLIVDELSLKNAKTKDLLGNLEKLGLSSALLIGGDQLDENFVRAARNIIGIDVLPQQGANVYDILRRDTLVLTKEAVEHLEARLK